MKYTIELTEKQANQLNDIMIGINASWGYASAPKLKMNLPLPITESPAYKKGLEDGNKIADKDLKEIQNTTYVATYSKGYNSAINDYNMMIQWLHDCTDNFKEFMNKKYGYDIMYLTNPHVDEGVMLYDLICDHDIAEVISEFKKWQEEKKKAEEESIKVGDEVTVTDFDALVGYTFIVMQIIGKRVVGIRDDWRLYENLSLEYLEKTGRHFDEIEQLLDKMRWDKEWDYEQYNNLQYCDNDI